jgi:hypothetical protein
LMASISPVSQTVAGSTAGRNPLIAFSAQRR